MPRFYLFVWRRLNASKENPACINLTYMFSGITVRPRSNFLYSWCDIFSNLAA